MKHQTISVTKIKNLLALLLAISSIYYTAPMSAAPVPAESCYGALTKLTQIAHERVERLTTYSDLILSITNQPKTAATVFQALDNIHETDISARTAQLIGQSAEQAHMLEGLVRGINALALSNSEMRSLAERVKSQRSWISRVFWANILDSHFSHLEGERIIVSSDLKTGMIREITSSTEVRASRRTPFGTSTDDSIFLLTGLMNENAGNSSEYIQSTLNTWRDFSFHRFFRNSGPRFQAFARGSESELSGQVSLGDLLRIISFSAGAPSKEALIERIQIYLNRIRATHSQQAVLLPFTEYLAELRVGNSGRAKILKQRMLRLPEIVNTRIEPLLRLGLAADDEKEPMIYFLQNMGQMGSDSDTYAFLAPFVVGDTDLPLDYWNVQEVKDFPLIVSWTLLSLIDRPQGGAVRQVEKNLLGSTYQIQHLINDSLTHARQ